jgi:uncharacterized metal-binding protein YceD (DUF177 family)
MNENNEYSRSWRLDQLGELALAVTLTTEPTEREALAKRFRLLALDQLQASAVLVRSGDSITATGVIEARVTQSCVATGSPVAAQIYEPFRLRFVPDSATSEAELELSEDDCDIIPYPGGAIDLGAAVADTLALALDPYPRAVDADAQLKAMGVLGEEDAGPFAALKQLRDKR